MREANERLVQSEAMIMLTLAILAAAMGCCEATNTSPVGRRGVSRDRAERLRVAIAALCIDSVPEVAASFGITTVQSGDMLASLLARVDQTLYRAKQQGGHCVMS
jgi:GGDEF domain-containing protein